MKRYLIFVLVLVIIVSGVLYLIFQPKTELKTELVKVNDIFDLESVTTSPVVFSAKGKVLTQDKSSFNGTVQIGDKKIKIKDGEFEVNDIIPGGYDFILFDDKGEVRSTEDKILQVLGEAQVLLIRTKS